jgi:hypothetical protein
MPALSLFTCGKSPAGPNPGPRDPRAPIILPLIPVPREPAFASHPPPSIAPRPLLPLILIRAREISARLLYVGVSAGKSAFLREPVNESSYYYFNFAILIFASHPLRSVPRPACYFIRKRWVLYEKRKKKKKKEMEKEKVGLTAIPLKSDIVLSLL